MFVIYFLIRGGMHIKNDPNFKKYLVILSFTQQFCRKFKFSMSENMEV